MPLHVEIVESLDYADPVSPVTIGTASATLVAANDSRKYLHILNTGAAAIYLAFGATAVVGSGIYVAATSGTFEMTIDNLTNEAVTAKSGGSGNVVYIQEAN